MESLTPPDLVSLFLFPFALGLLGFVEPCSIGSSLLFLKYVEGSEAVERVAHTVLFTLTRATFMGGLGATAALIGATVLGIQRAGWLFLGALYVVLGVMYVTGKARKLARRVGPRLDRLSGTRGAVGLAVLFGLNVPACAAPLLFAVLGSAAVDGAGGVSHVAKGFLSLAVFGFALSMPLVAVVAWSRTRQLLDRVSSLSARVPTWIGLLLVVFGLWSLYFGLFVSPKP
jgi:cytochrome c-type biogenesis protein